MKTFLIILIPYALILSVALIRRPPRAKEATAAPRKLGDRLRILVVGATGGTGRAIVRQALEMGHEVNAFVRNPARLGMEHPNLRVIQGDVLIYASLEPAMTGQDAVICALGHKRWFYPNRILSKGTGHILRAMQARAVPRFICESSLGIGSGVGRLGLIYTVFTIPLILPFLFWDKLRQEKLIQESDVDWVIVRPAGLTNGPARGRYRHGRNIGSFIWTNRIARADVADFMLKQLTDDTYVGSAVAVCG